MKQKLLATVLAIALTATPFAIVTCSTANANDTMKQVSGIVTKKEKLSCGCYLMAVETNGTKVQLLLDTLGTANVTDDESVNVRK